MSPQMAFRHITSISEKLGKWTEFKQTLMSKVDQVRSYSKSRIVMGSPFLFFFLSFWDHKSKPKLRNVFKSQTWLCI